MKLKDINNDIDVNSEFRILTNFARELWDGLDNPYCLEGMKKAFQSGLTMGKFWIDQYITFRIAMVLNGEDKNASPLSREDIAYMGNSSAYLYDALYIFDQTLSHGVGKIWSSVTDYKGWNYSQMADSICARIQAKHGLINVEPKEVSNEFASQLVDSYTGLRGEFAGSFSTPEKFKPDYVLYSRDNQGLSLFGSFFSNFFSHGLYVAQAYNTRHLVNDLLPIYSLRNNAINFDNGPELLKMCIHNPFVDLVNRITPFCFSSTEAYLQGMSNKRQEPMSKEELDRFLKEMIFNITSNKYLEKEQAEDKQTREIIDEFGKSYKGLKLEV